MVILVPVTLAVITIIENADRIAAQARSLVDFSLAGPPAWIEAFRLPESVLQHGGMNSRRSAPMSDQPALSLMSKNTVTWFMGQAGDIGMMIVQFLLTIIIAAILFAQGERPSRASGYLPSAGRITSRRSHRAGREGGTRGVFSASC